MRRIIAIIVVFLAVGLVIGVIATWKKTPTSTGHTQKGEISTFGPAKTMGKSTLSHGGPTVRPDTGSQSMGNGDHDRYDGIKGVPGAPTMTPIGPGSHSP